MFHPLTEERIAELKRNHEKRRQNREQQERLIEEWSQEVVKGIVAMNETERGGE